MAQLHQVIGAILRDIAQARVTSDLYSRETSRYYEQDALLRLFPIPRSEIREITMDLQFVIADVAEDPERRQERDARIHRVFDLYADLLTDEIILRLKNPGPSVDESQWAAVYQTFQTPEFRLQLSERMIVQLEQSSNLIRGGSEAGDEMYVVEDIEYARNDINRLLDSLVYSRDDVNKFELRQVKANVSTGLRDILEAMQHDLRVSLEAGKEHKVEVDVTAEKLQAIPESAISSIRITTSMRNYLWSQVEEKDGKPIRRLIPE